MAQQAAKRHGESTHHPEHKAKNQIKGSLSFSSLVCVSLQCGGSNYPFFHAGVESPLSPRACPNTLSAELIDMHNGFLLAIPIL